MFLFKVRRVVSCLFHASSVDVFVVCCSDLMFHVLVLMFHVIASGY